jgi:hypothetical protein
MTSFVLFGFLSIILLKLSYEDWKTKLIDAPITLFASGFVSAAYLLNSRFIEFVCWGLIFLVAWRFLKPFCEKNNLLGAGDVSVLSFLLPAAWFVNAWLLSVFLFVFGLIMFGWFKKKLFDKTEKPLVPVIAVAWILTWIIAMIFFK